MGNCNSRSTRGRRVAEAIVQHESRWDDDSTGSMLIELDAKNPKHAAELQAVTQRFKSTWAAGHGYALPANPAVYRAYQIKKCELLAANPGHPVDILAWHGSKANGIDAIVQCGFDVGMGVCQPGALWFAQQSNFSAVYATVLPRRILSVRLCPLVAEVANHNIVRDTSRMLPEHVITFE